MPGQARPAKHPGDESRRPETVVRRLLQRLERFGWMFWELKNGGGLCQARVLALPLGRTGVSRGTGVGDISVVAVENIGTETKFDHLSNYVQNPQILPANFVVKRVLPFSPQFPPEREDKGHTHPGYLLY